MGCGAGDGRGAGAVSRADLVASPATRVLLLAGTAAAAACSRDPAGSVHEAYSSAQAAEWIADRAPYLREGGETRPRYWMLRCPPRGPGIGIRSACRTRSCRKRITPWVTGAISRCSFPLWPRAAQGLCGQSSGPKTAPPFASKRRVGACGLPRNGCSQRPIYRRSKLMTSTLRSAATRRLATTRSTSSGYVAQKSAEWICQTSCSHGNTVTSNCSCAPSMSGNTRSRTARGVPESIGKAGA